MSMDKVAYARQLNLFAADSVITEADVQRIIDEAHRMRMAAFKEFVGGLAAAFGRYRRAAATKRSLSGLSDAVLADIGVERELIPEIARKLAADEPMDWDATPSAVSKTPAAVDKRPINDDTPELPLAA